MQEEQGTPYDLRIRPKNVEFSGLQTFGVNDVDNVYKIGEQRPENMVTPAFFMDLLDEDSDDKDGYRLDRVMKYEPPVEYDDSVE